MSSETDLRPQASCSVILIRQAMPLVWPWWIGLLEHGKCCITNNNISSGLSEVSVYETYHSGEVSKIENKCSKLRDCLILEVTSMQASATAVGQMWWSVHIVSTCLTASYNSGSSVPWYVCAWGVELISAPTLTILYQLVKLQYI